MNRSVTLFLTIIFAIQAGSVSAQSPEKNGSLPDTVTIHVGDTTAVTLSSFCKNPLQGILYIHVHEDEKTAVAAVTQYMDSTGKGCFVTLQHGMGRNIRFTLGGLPFQFDPNRIYTQAGRKATLAKAGVYSDPAFEEVTQLSEALLTRFVAGKKLLIALHNNTNMGGLSIRSYQKGGGYARDASKVAIHKNQDEDDFFYTTSERAFQFFKKKGFNVMLQNNATVTDDGSLSVYAGLQGIDYINLEAEHGHLGEQIRMLQAVTDYIYTFYPEASVGGKGNKF